MLRITVFKSWKDPRRGDSTGLEGETYWKNWDCYGAFTRTKGILPLMGLWIQLEGFLYSVKEVRQRKPYIGAITYLWNLKKAKFTETERKVVVARGGAGERRSLNGVQGYRCSYEMKTF